MLDLEKIFETYDKNEMSYGIEHMPQQVRVAFDQAIQMQIGKRFRGCERVVIFGMGGAAAAGEMIAEATELERTIPVEIVRGYHAPRSLNHKTLAIFVSTSGETIEVLSAIKSAKKRQAKCLVIAGGGVLLKQAKTYKCPYLVMDAQEFAHSPREAIGYTFGSILGVLSALKVVKMTKKRIDAIVAAMADVVGTCELQVEEEKNPAKSVAREILPSQVILFSAEHLSGVGKMVRNTLNEIGKHFVVHEVLPEANHHFDEALFLTPSDAFECIFFRSDLYDARNKQRMEETASFHETLGYGIIDYQTKGTDTLEQAAELMQFGAFVGYYLSLLKERQPEKPAELVELKRRLTK